MKTNQKTARKRPLAKPRSSLPIVTADTHDDDYEFVVEGFMCNAWFKQASDQAILELAECGFRSDYPADVVAEFFYGAHVGITKMFDRKRRGFECVVDPSQAMNWIRAHRPHLYSQCPEL